MAWSLFFIGLIYLSVPALAVLVKFEVLNTLVGSRFAELPSWMAQWARLDSALLEFSDVNGDGILQLGELKLGADMIMLATPELGGMPFVVSGLVAAGGLAAALSTADGLLLTISNAWCGDMRPNGVKGPKSSEGRVILSKFALLAVAMLAAGGGRLQARRNSGLGVGFFFAGRLGILSGHGVGHGLAAGTSSGRGTGHAGRFGCDHLLHGGQCPCFRHFWELDPYGGLWWGIQPLSAGVFGVPVGFAAMVLATWLIPQRLISQNQRSKASNRGPTQQLSGTVIFRL